MSSPNRTTYAMFGLFAVVVVAAAACGSDQGSTSSASPSGTISAPPKATYPAEATLTGPITVGHVVEPLSGLPLDLAADGYVEQEFFASGTATAFTATSAPNDGKWTIAPAATAPYRTRILVRRPTDPARFNGTVVVEWLNVSAGESDPDWDYLNPELTRDGYAYVGVSAQALAVNGGTPLLGSLSAVASDGLIHDGAGPVRNPPSPR